MDRPRALPEPRGFVAGEVLVPARRLPGALEDPHTGQPLAERRGADTAQLESVLAAAAAAHADARWSGRPLDERLEVLARAGALVAEHLEALAVAESLDTGVPLATTRLTIGGAAAALGGAAAVAAGGAARELGEPDRPVVLHRVPRGPLAVLLPWNAPVPVLLPKLLTALVHGAPVVVKPSEWATSSLTLLAPLLAEAGLPDGVLGVVPGDAELAAQLVADPRIAAVSLTGSRAAGRAVGAIVAGRLGALQLELGANNPALVLPDAEVEQTARLLARAATVLCGQWCEAPGRVLVAPSLAPPLCEALLTELGTLRAGDPLDDTVTLGPLAHREHLARVQAQLARLQQAGGVVHPAGAGAGSGSGSGVGSGAGHPSAFGLPASVVAGLPAAAVGEELFAPVLTLHEVADEAGMLAAAADPVGGLAAYVFSAEVPAAMALGARLPAGEVKVNSTSVLDLVADSEQSFWGGSGIGGHGQRLLDDLVLGSRIVGVDPPGRPL